MRVNFEGFCPVCEAETSFLAEREAPLDERFVPAWFRGALRCTACGSAPRQRAIAAALSKIQPDWRDLTVHECSPSGPLSGKLRRECSAFVATQYDPTFPFGEMSADGLWRNENLEDQTFLDESFDIVITQDVFEHLFHPGRAAREIARTLRPGGLCLMTVPVVNPWGETVRRAALRDGVVEHLLPEQYHGNPVADGRSLVTVDWSYDIGPYLSRHSGLSFAMLVIDDMRIGVRDPVNVVLVGRKGAPVDLGEAEAAGAEERADPLGAAEAQRAAGQPETAVAMLDAIDPTHPAWFEGRRRAARAHGAAGRADRARAAAEVAHAARPTALWPIRLLADLDAAEGDRAAEAARLARLHELSPYDPDLAARFAAVARALGRDAEAREAEARQADWARFDISALPQWRDTAEPSPQGAALYLDLMERALTNVLYRDPSFSEGRSEPFSEDRRRCGRDIPATAHTMIGQTRLRHLRRCVETVIREDVPGDLIEAGVWRGGACILMRAALEALDDRTRRVFAADSFAGLPPPDSRFPEDALTTFDFHLRPELAVSLETVRDNFARYGLLDDRVVFVEGLFHETLPELRDETFALLRLDGDLYSSTMDTLENLYDRVSPGGFVILDDYGAVFDARRAARDFRETRGIDTPIIAINGDAVFWRKE